MNLRINPGVLARVMLHGSGQNQPELTSLNNKLFFLLLLDNADPAGGIDGVPAIPNRDNGAIAKHLEMAIGAITQLQANNNQQH